MLKYANYEVVFREIPDETTLAINITNCPCHCPDCHSKYLWEDNGIELDYDEIKYLIRKNTGITCIAFMGGDRYKDDLYLLTKYVHDMNPDIKIAIYSGETEYHVQYLKYLTYLKLGPYIKEYGALDNPNTNQKLFLINKGRISEDITYKFWRKSNAK